MLVNCPLCNFDNQIEDSKEIMRAFSFQCEKCTQLLSVKVQVEALNVIHKKGEAASNEPKNYVYEYLKENMDAVKLPVLPGLASRIKQLKAVGKSNVKSIAGIVRSDQIIASKILQIANSAMYGGLVEITNLNQAITRLGMRTTETMVTALENRRIYASEDQEMIPILQSLWKHALGVAVTSQKIATQLDQENAEEIFTAGLMHDFGYVLFLQALKSDGPFRKKMKKMDMAALLQIAKSHHAEIGADYLKKAGLPASLVNIVRYHEEIPPEETQNQALHVVVLSNLLCAKVGIAPAHDPDMRLELTESAQELGLNELDLASLEVACEDLVEKITSLLA